MSANILFLPCIEAIQSLITPNNNVDLVQFLHFDKREGSKDTSLGCWWNLLGVATKFLDHSKETLLSNLLGTIVIGVGCPGYLLIMPL